MLIRLDGGTIFRNDQWVGWGVGPTLARILCSGPLVVNDAAMNIGVHLLF